MKTEFRVPALVPACTSGGLADHAIESAAKNPHGVSLSIHRGGAWVGVSAQQFLDDVRAVAKGLIGSGVQTGQRVGVMSRTRYEWTLVDFAIWYAGCVSVPIYETSSAEQVEWILSDSNAVALFVESEKNKTAFDHVSGHVPGVTRCWVFDSDGISQIKSLGTHVS